MKNKDNKHAENTSDQPRVSNDGKKAKAAAHTLTIVNYKYTHELSMMSKSVKKCKTPTLSCNYLNFPPSPCMVWPVYANQALAGEALNRHIKDKEDDPHLCKLPDKCCQRVSVP